MRTDRQAVRDRVYLVGVIHPEISRDVVEDHLDELALLADTAGGEVVGRFIQKVERIQPRTYIGSGKAEEILHMAEENGVPLVIFDDELSPSQIRNLQEMAGEATVTDRTGVILEVFEQHATSREAKTQVEMARLQYQLPRLTRMWRHLERQMGARGTRAGAGERQIETDRRMIRTRIEKLKEELRQIDRERATQGRKRAEAFRAALVGYTNAGKSTLMNALSGSEVYVRDQLFATLDTTVRSVQLDTTHRILLSDSVGFIRKLPHTLIASFRSTLKEILDADLLLLVADAAAPGIENHLATVREVLESIGAHQKDTLLVLNKADLVVDRDQLGELRRRFPEGIAVSASRRLFLDRLVEAIANRMDASRCTAVVEFESARGRDIASVFRVVEVIAQDYSGETVRLTVRGTPADVGRVKQLAVGSDGGR